MNSTVPRTVAIIHKEARAAGAAGDRDREEILYGEAVDLEPRNPVALFNLATVRYKRGDYRSAGELFDRVTELRPSDHEAWLYYGVCENRAGRKQSALKAFSRVLELDPTNAYASRMVSTLSGK